MPPRPSPEAGPSTISRQRDHKRIPPGIQVYRLDTAFFLRRGGEVITLDEVRDPERVAAWLTRMSQGVNTEEYATHLGDAQRNE